MFVNLFAQNCRFFLETEYPCEERFWKTLELPGICRGHVAIKFFHDLKLPCAPTVGVYYSDGEWGATPEFVAYNRSSGWNATQKFVAGSDMEIKSEDQLKREIKAYLKTGWMCVNSTLLTRLGT